jgi:hypothetical protein
MKRLILAAVAAAGLLVGCSADSTDFKEQAEKDIKDDVEKQGVADADVSCDKPADTDVGTSFNCNVTSGGAQVASYTATITDEKTYTYTLTGGGDTPTEGEDVESDTEDSIEEGVEQVEEGVDEVEEGVDEVQEEVEDTEG